MITLSEHNARKLRTWESKNLPLPNQIKCPSCGEEMMDTHPMQLIESSKSAPPRKAVHCPKCGYRDSRFA